MTITNFGDNFEIEEDSNGDYVITYVPTNTIIERIDSGNEEKILEVGTRINDLIDATSGATVYDTATQTVGDGTTSANHGSVSTGEQRTGGDPVHNVKYYGAVGDGSADDTTAIQDAADAAAPNGTVYFPTGTYLVSADINLKGASVDGAGMFEVTVKAGTGGSYDLGISTTGGDHSVLWAENENHWSVQNIGIDANGNDASGVTNYGGNWVTLTQIYSRNSDDCGIQHWGGAGENTNDCYNCAITNCAVESNRWNLVLDGGLFNCAVMMNVSFSADTRHMGVDNRAHTDSDARGVHLSHNVLRSSGSDSTTQEAIIIRGGSSGDPQRSTDGRVYGHVSDNFVYGWSGKAARLERADPVFEGNTFHSDFANSDAFSKGIEVASQNGGINLRNNHFVAVTGPLFDLSAANSDRIYVLGNTDSAGTESMFDGSTDAEWVFDMNYSGTTQTSP